MSSYPGNIGMQEMFKFYETATEAEKRKMKELMTKKNGFNEAWDYLQLILGIKLHKPKTIKENFDARKNFEMLYGIIK